MTEKLARKVAVVTGASKGIGSAIALALAREGAAVVVNYRSARIEAEKVVAEILEERGRAIAVQADMSIETDIRRLFDDTLAAFGRLDILVNNAGIYEFAPLEEVTPAHFHRQFDLNVLGLLLASREAARHFGSDGGSIINISSLAARDAPPTTAVYSATKAAVDAVTRCLSQELGRRKIRVNSINPGLVETEGVHAAGLDDGEFRRQLEARTPLARIGQPDDVAPAAVFLASDDASWITGETFYVSGGCR
jgi:3-oxoacyl-[acyl-carrier protein] reductase